MNTQHIKNLCKRGFYNIYKWYCEKNNIQVLSKNMVFAVLYGKNQNGQLLELLYKIFDGKDFSEGTIGKTGNCNTNSELLKEFKARVNTITQSKPTRAGNYVIYCYVTPKHERYTRHIFYKASKGILYCPEIVEFLEKTL
jgi:hypothetical protein